jgi:hypothetical protein
MLHALTLLATEAAAEPEKSKTAFYILGGLLAAYAVVLAALGMTRATFPESDGAKRGVMAVSFVLMAAAMATAVLTA